MQGVMRDAGFAGIQVTAEEFELVYADEQEWFSHVNSLAWRPLFDAMGLEVLEKFKTDAFEKIRVIQQPDGVHQLYRVLFTVATKPRD